MTDWLLERWLAEALVCIAAGFILAVFICKLADLLDR